MTQPRFFKEECQVVIKKKHLHIYIENTKVIFIYYILPGTYRLRSSNPHPLPLKTIELLLNMFHRVAIVTRRMGFSFNEENGQNNTRFYTKNVRLPS